MDGLRGDTKTLFLPWMHYMPVVECEWALNLVRGMATVSRAPPLRPPTPPLSLLPRSGCELSCLRPASLDCIWLGWSSTLEVVAVALVVR